MQQFHIHSRENNLAIIFFHSSLCNIKLVKSKQDFVKEAAMAKLVASETALKVTAKCIDFMGGVGFTTEFPQEKYFRDCKIDTIYEGTSNMKLSTIAKHIRKAYS
ncbi:hypothetical protein PV328_012022 [Microctonus aethiopoides]|uniref:Short/branched chain specific acyl-CoA dehydrogenase, mitochondrial n=1 Tax=Microctonus aethiopoides TaxID=144406 RepID=A0AA39EUA5_9HYME|nr:hypothetical protein PV328_012022 [Microctonus aethiopoides]